MSNGPAGAGVLARALCTPAAFAHPADAIELVETHISWVVLAGDFAYKLKKPVDFGFLDYSTLAKRRVACEDEVRLNRRLAPDLYLDVAPIAGPATAPRVDGAAPAIEYAVRMRRFDRTQELDRLLAAGTLAAARIDELATVVAGFHAVAPHVDPAQPWGTPAAVLAAALDNFAAVHRIALPALAARVDALAAWTRTSHAALAPLLATRRDDGLVRECHGDLHLANIVVHQGRVLVFDCIEFNPALRWIDVMSEIAFTTMDLRHRGRPDLAQRFLNRYLEETGDYAGLPALRWFAVYRAMVRAKVAALRAAQESDPAARRRDEADALTHVALAETLASPASPALVITHGASGCGKSFAAAAIAAHGDWVRIRADVERKRLAGLPALAASDPAVDLYAGTMSERTYAALAALARPALAAGFSVLVDATFLARRRRDAMRALATDLRVPFVVLAPQATPAMMAARIATRAAAGNDPSEATAAVLARQLAAAEPLATDEAPFVVAFDAAGPVDGVALNRAIAACIAGG